MKPTSKETSNELKLAFEEFQLFYESTEKVTDRRLETNRWNYSICTTILTVNGVLLSWALSNSSFFIISTIGVILLSIMATLFCSLWIAQIQDFKLLNNAKFKVLNDMAPCIRFSSEESDDRKSYSPFEKEWETLKDSKAVQEMYSMNIIALNSSNIEYIIPIAFRILFLLIIVVAVVIAIRNWDLVTASTSLQFPTATPTPTILPTPTP